MEDIQQRSESPTPPVHPAPPNAGSQFMVPLAILAGFGMIAVAIYFSGGKAPATVQNNNLNPETAQEATPVPPVSAEDHILGNPNAPIVIVEYSDYDCPFCKRFHETMHTVMDTYGSSGKVAWVYRHFPLDTIHPSAAYIASAAECVAELGGNDAFWTFSDLVFGERELNQLTDTTRLPEFATTAGVDVSAFNECVTSERTMPLVEADLAEGISAGVRGTPYSFIMIAGQQLPVNGAQPIEYMTANIDGLLLQLEQVETEPPAVAE
jgi:protein-disulfide isomerase